jgi:predicted transcriptional regulator
VGRYYRRNNQPSRKARLSAILGGFDKDILDTFYQLDWRQFDLLIAYYRQDYGDSAAAYARRTYPRWKYGEVDPSGQTIERLLITLPRVLDIGVKCDLLRKLRERHRKKDNISLKVDPNNWRETIEPIVLNIVRKAYTAELPQVVQDRLTWLSSSDMQAAKALLSEAEAVEGRIAISLLHKEFANIDILLSSLAKGSKITHTIILPYGNVNLTIKRSRKSMSDNQNVPNSRSLFRPSAKDIMDNALENLDPQQVKQMAL